MMTIHRMSSPTDPLAPEWVRVYERSFPERERMQVAHYWSALQAAARGEGDAPNMLALMEGGALQGIADWVLADPECAWLYYIAAREPGGGRGARLFDAVVGDIGAHVPAVQAVLIEVEIPDAPTTHDAVIAARRIGWYRRMGAWLLEPLEGYTYIQEVGDWQPETPMALMLYRMPGAGLRPDEGLRLIKKVVGDALTVRAPVRLA